MSLKPDLTVFNEKSTGQHTIMETARNILDNIVIPPFKPTGLKVSTMCATCKTGTPVNYALFFAAVPLIPYYYPGEGCLKVKLGNNVRGTRDKDVRDMGRRVRTVKTDDTIDEVSTTSKSTKGKKGNTFLHQTTAVYRVATGSSSDAGPWKEVNVKVFTNGSLQMSGISSVEIAERAERLVLNDINRINTETGGDMLNPASFPVKVDKKKKVVKKISPTAGTTAPAPVEVVPAPPLVDYSKATIKMAPIDISLINSDFSVMFPVRREELQHVLSTTYGIHAQFESTEYQGVKASFMWNTDYMSDKKNYPSAGVCYCEKKTEKDKTPHTRCSKGDGPGHGVGGCQRVTIAIFQTGKVIITGARSYKQLETVHSFISTVIHDNMNSVYRRCLVPVVAVERKRGRYMQRNVVRIPGGSRVPGVPSGHPAPCAPIAPGEHALRACSLKS